MVYKTIPIETFKPGRLIDTDPKELTNYTYKSQNE
jgi:hypothetical protein